MNDINEESSVPTFNNDGFEDLYFKIFIVSTLPNITFINEHIILYRWQLIAVVVGSYL